MKCTSCFKVFTFLLFVCLSVNLNAQVQKDTLQTGNDKFWVSPYDYRNSKDAVTASVSQVDGSLLERTPGTNRMNAVSGLVSGLVNIQGTGELGWEYSSMYIRGLRSLESGNQPIIIVDGYYRENAKYLNPYDIESITVLKDAASTAIYGLRGGSGAILITTKRGRAQDLKVSFDANFTASQPTSLPKILNSYDYARLYNEALLNDGENIRYSPADLEGYAQGTDQFKYPDINWLDKFYQNNTFSQKYNVNLRGGSDQALYFVSAGYTNNSGIFDVNDTLNTYNTNLNYDAIDLRGNMDVRITPLMNLSMDVASKISKWNSPGNLMQQELMTNLVSIPPNAFPIFNEDGSLGGTTQYTTNPYGMLNRSGYSINKSRALHATLYVDHKLNFIVDNLTAYGSLSFDNYYDQAISRHRGYFVYEGNKDNPKGTGQPVTQQNSNAFGIIYRAFDVRAGLKYANNFSGQHDVSANLFVNQNTESGNGRMMPHVYKGLMGQAHYAYNNRYLMDFSFAWQGSEQLSPDKPYMFFPAVSLGWIMSNEDFIPVNPILSFLKLRGSYGITGLDSGISYYQKATIFRNVGSVYLTGEGLSTYNSYRRSQVGVGNILAERFFKTNIGLDTRFFRNKLYINLNLFHERGIDLITSSLSIPSIYGSRGDLRVNAGEVVNRGFEIEAGFNQSIGDFNYSLFSTFSFARNKIVDMQEDEVLYPYNARTGQSLGARFGLISEGLFYDANQVASSPKQNFGSYGPGDIKYRNLNDDNEVNIDDRTRIGYGSVPEYVYGFGFNMNYKGFDLSAFFQGVGNVDKYMSGLLYWEFQPNGTGNVYEHHKERWAYYPDQNIDTRSTASYPRLTLGGTNTNNRNPSSDYWVKDASYLRLKNIELGYSLPKKATNFLFLEQLRLYVSACNLLTFDKIKMIDPELGTSAMNIPIQKNLNVGINLQF